MSASQNTTRSPEVTCTARHMAWPLPCSVPYSGRTSAAATTVAPAASATAAVSSVEPSSMTTSSSTSGSAHHQLAADGLHRGADGGRLVAGGQAHRDAPASLGRHQPRRREVPIVEGAQHGGGHPATPETGPACRRARESTCSGRQTADNMSARHHQERLRDGPCDAAATSALRGRQVPMPGSMSPRRNQLAVRGRSALPGVRAPVSSRGAACVRVVLRAPRGRLRLRRHPGGRQPGVDRGRPAVDLALRRPAAGGRRGRRQPGRRVHARWCGPTGWPPSSASGELWIKNDTLNPTGSFKDRVVSVALTKAQELGFKVAACASTGNLANSVAAHAAHAGHGVGRVHPRRPRGRQGGDHRRVRRPADRGRRQLRRRQPAVRRAGRRAPVVGVRQRQRPHLLRRGVQDAGLRGGRAARLAGPRPRGGAGGVGQPADQGGQGLQGAVHRRPARRGAPRAGLGRPGGRLLPGGAGLRSRPRRGQAGEAGHHRQVAGHRQPGRRALRPGRGARLGRFLRLRSPTRRSSPASGCWPAPRASSPRPPAG